MTEFIQAAILAFVVGTSIWSLFVIAHIVRDFYRLWKRDKEIKDGIDA
jgi:nucleoside recognition membrane protein YjiH